MRCSAEAELTAATFAHDPKRLKLARHALKSALEAWRRANQALIAHERTHVMTAGVAPRIE
jgi:histidinol phosphatase-like PHP family hydrolase